MWENFYDPETASSSGATPVPSQPCTNSESQDHASPRFWIAARYTEYCGYFRKRFWTTSCSRRTNLYSLRKIKELGFLFSRIETWHSRKYKATGKRTDTRTAEYLHHASKVEVEHWIIPVALIFTVVSLISRGFQSRKFPDSMEFQSWKVNFKTEECSKSADLHLTMHWANEVDIA